MIFEPAQQRGSIEPIFNKLLGCEVFEGMVLSNVELIILPGAGHNNIRLEKRLDTIAAELTENLAVVRKYIHVGEVEFTLANWGRTKVECRQLKHELKSKVLFRP